MLIHRQPIWPANQSLGAKNNQSFSNDGNRQENSFFDGERRAIRAISKILGSSKTNFSNKGQVAVALGKINTISNNKFICNFKA